MDRQDYTAAVLSALRRVTSRERAAIRAEIDGHIEDHMEGLLELGYDPDLAEERALAAMGDPKEVGRELNRQYPFRWLAVRWGARLLSAWAALAVFLLAMNTVGAQTSPLAALRERIQPNLSHHFPSLRSLRDCCGGRAAGHRGPAGQRHCAGGAALRIQRDPLGRAQGLYQRGLL